MIIIATVSTLQVRNNVIRLKQIFSVSGYITPCIAAAHGWGHLSPYVSQRNQTIAFKFLFAAQVFWIFATVLVRKSVACSLLRLSRCTGDAERLWRWCLWGLIGVQFLASTGWLVLLIFNCHPLRGMWEPLPNLTCWDHKYTVNYGWVVNRKTYRDRPLRGLLTRISNPHPSGLYPCHNARSAYSDITASSS